MTSKHDVQWFNVLYIKQSEEEKKMTKHVQNPKRSLKARDQWQIQKLRQILGLRYFSDTPQQLKAELCQKVTKAATEICSLKVGALNFEGVV